MLTRDRNTPRRDGDFLVLPIKASTTIYAGSLVFVDTDGFAVPGSASPSLRAAGRAEEHVVNRGPDGARAVRVRRGVFRWQNAIADPLTAADTLADCYAVDDEAVGRTDDGGTRPQAGKVLEVASDGVWVQTEWPGSGTIGTADLASEAVTTGKIAADAVTTAKIVDDAVTTAKIVDGAVTEDKMALPDTAGLNLPRAWVGKYSFSEHGGAQGAIDIDAAAIPANAVILGGVVDVHEILASEGAATAALHVEAGDDLVAATVVSGEPWSTQGLKTVVPVFTSATYVKTSVARKVQITVGAADLKAGQFTVVLLYVVTGPDVE